MTCANCWSEISGVFGKDDCDFVTSDGLRSAESVSIPVRPFK